MRAGTGGFSFVQEALGRKQFNPRDIAGGKTGLGVADTSTRSVQRRLTPRERIASGVIVAQGALRVAQCGQDGLFIAQRGLPLNGRSEEHTSELQSLMRISYAVFCLKKKKSKPRNSRHLLTNNKSTNTTHRPADQTKPHSNTLNTTRLEPTLVRYIVQVLPYASV